MKTELFVTFFALVAGAILAIILANSFFLERYYIRQKQEALSESYARLNEAADANEITSDAFAVEIQTIMSRDNMEVVVMSPASKAVRVYAADSSVMMRRMWDNLLDNTELYPESEGAAEDFYIVRNLTDRNYGQRLQIVLEQETGSRYMEMWGILGDGSYYLMRTTLESIRNNSSIANRFTLYVGILVILIGAGAALLLGKRISEPVQRLTAISQRMRELDFSAKYEGNEGNEIQELGENINRLSKTLESTISDLKTANNELRQDIEQKERVESMQREFISNVTHELKTPLALIQGYAEGLQEGMGDDPESRAYYCEVITDEAGKMNRMVQKLLTLSHLEFGQNEVSMSRLDVNAMITGILRSSEPLIQEKGAEILFAQRDPVWVWADEYLTEEVFQNYFSNALHYTEKVIDIRLEQKENCVRISVFNSGKPIPEESLDRIWDKFYKVDKARTREYGGSGVGLSIVRAIMESMHRDYGVKNYENGVEFWFELDTSAAG